MEPTDAVFQRDGALFVPTPSASGPWAADKLHGGPVFGLLTRAVEEAAADASLVGTRLTFDLFRAVPLAPLSVRAELVRQSSRLCLVQAELQAEGEAYARATALLLRPDPEDATFSVQGGALKPRGPEGLEIETLMRTGGIQPRAIRPGFHTRIQTRWVPREEGAPLGIWFHLPIPLVAGEQASPLQLVAALSDFGNAIANIAQRGRSERPSPYVNVDSTLYLNRAPRGEWICLQEHSVAAGSGTSVCEVALFDAAGPLGTAQQARLAQRMSR
jgi:hypothetical protein